jgi:hypothetical protein
MTVTNKVDLEPLPLAVVALVWLPGWRRKSPLPTGIRDCYIDGINGLRVHVLEAGFQTSPRSVYRVHPAATRTRPALRPESRASKMILQARGERSVSRRPSAGERDRVNIEYTLGEFLRELDTGGRDGRSILHDRARHRS